MCACVCVCVCVCLSLHMFVIIRERGEEGSLVTLNIIFGDNNIIIFNTIVLTQSEVVNV